MSGSIHPISVAPMMDRTDRHFRYLVRQVSRRLLLYTEMVTTRAVIHGRRDKLLGYDAAEHPIALQVGGDDPRELAECAAIAEDWGYDEININVGCPSERVQKGSFGACLMKTPEVVAEGVAAMRARTRIPVTVKHRIGVDEMDRYEDLLRFVDVVRQAKPARFSVHARKAWLKGLSPKQNRTVPPLRYEDVHRLAAERPELEIEINGGIVDLYAAEAQLEQVSAVMIGRAAYDDPMIFADCDQRIYGEPHSPRDRIEVARAMIPYAAKQVASGHKLHSVTRHMMGLFKGQAGARGYRRTLSTEGVSPSAGPQVLERALAHIEAARAAA